jgi:predicted phosphodiesterase
MPTSEFQELIGKILDNFDKAKELNETEINLLLTNFSNLVSSNKTLARIKTGSVLVIGDIHGDFPLMKSVVKQFLIDKKADHLVFLGDIVDRGTNSIACMNLLLALILKYPENVHIVRGNHESLSVNIRYGFLQEVQRFLGLKEQLAFYVNIDQLPDLFIQFNNAFANMSLALVHEKYRYFFVHGGIPKDPISLKEIDQLPKGDVNLKNPTIMELLWNDPSNVYDDYDYNMRGQGIYVYGVNLVKNFLKQNNLHMIIRAHQIFPDGFKYFFDRKLLSLFTSEEYYQGVQAKIAYLGEKGEIDIYSPKI